METRQRNLKSQKATATGETWEPQANGKNNFFFDEKNPNNTLEGYLVEVKEGVGQNNSTIYVIHEADEYGALKSKRSIWEDTVLADQMDAAINNHGINCFVVIKYKGRALKRQAKQQNPNQAWSQTNSYHLWEVFVDIDAPAYSSGRQSSPAQPQVQPTKEVAQTTKQNSDAFNVGGNPFGDTNSGDLPW